MKIACDSLNIDYTYIPIKRTGLAQVVFNDGKARGEKVLYKPVKYDKLVYKRNTINGHIETVYQVKEKGWVKTLAFNVDKKSNKIKTRNIYFPLGRMQVKGLIGFKEI